MIMVSPYCNLIIMRGWFTAQQLRLVLYIVILVFTISSPVCVSTSTTAGQDVFSVNIIDPTVFSVTIVTYRTSECISCCRAAENLGVISTQTKRICKQECEFIDLTGDPAVDPAFQTCQQKFISQQDSQLGCELGRDLRLLGVTNLLDPSVLHRCQAGRGTLVIEEKSNGSSGPSSENINSPEGCNSCCTSLETFQFGFSCPSPGCGSTVFSKIECQNSCASIPAGGDFDSTLATHTERLGSAIGKDFIEHGLIFLGSDPLLCFQGELRTEGISVNTLSPTINALRPTSSPTVSPVVNITAVAPAGNSEEGNSSLSSFYYIMGGTTFFVVTVFLIIVTIILRKQRRRPVILWRLPKSHRPSGLHPPDHFDPHYHRDGSFMSRKHTNDSYKLLDFFGPLRTIYSKTISRTSSVTRKSSDLRTKDFAVSSNPAFVSPKPKREYKGLDWAHDGRRFSDISDDSTDIFEDEDRSRSRVRMSDDTGSHSFSSFLSDLI